MSAEKNPTTLSGIKFVYFDAGYTLLKPEPSVGEIYSQIAEQFGHYLAADRLNEAFPLAWKKTRAKALTEGPLPYGRTLEEAEAFWTRVIQRTIEFGGYQPPEDDAFYSALFHHFEKAECWTLYEDVLPALDALEQAGIPCGILSNWDPRLHYMLEALGIRGRFQQIIVSCDVGAEKPDPAIYRVATAAVGFSPASILHIGDEPNSDGEGAKAAGWNACVVSRKGPTGKFEREATSLLEALEINVDSER